MSDEEKTTTTTAADADPKQPSAEDKGKSDDADDDLKGLPDDWKKSVKGLRSEIAAKRAEAKSAKEEAKAAREEAAQLRKAKEDEELAKKKQAGEWEKIASDREAALQKTNERLMRAELRLIAQREGILDPTDVNNLALEGLTLGDDGEVHGAEKLIKKLKDSKPHWFKAATTEEKKPEPKSTSSKISEPPPGTGSEKQDLSDLKPDEFEKRKKDFLASIKARSR